MDIRLKELARDIHYALIEKCGLPDSPQNNHAARETILALLSQQVEAARNAALTDRDISTLVEIAQALREVPHWQAKVSSRLIAEIAKTLIPAAPDSALSSPAQAEQKGNAE